MQSLLKYSALVLLCVLSSHLIAQTPWLWAESIDRSNAWNEPFYKPYNSADKLLAYQADSLNYCKDCSLPNLLWKGIEANKIAIYQIDKKSKLSRQKLSILKPTLLAQLNHTDSAVELMRNLLSISEVIIYRRADTTNANTINALPIEWIALKFLFEKDTITLYLRSNECFTYLTSNECMWVHPLNHHIKLSMAHALIQRNYIIRDFKIVSATNLKALSIYKTTLPPLAEKLKQNGTHTSTGAIQNNNDTLLIRLQTMYHADIREELNRGLNKAHIIEYLLKLHAENKIKGYAFHEAGYFTTMQSNALFGNLLTFKVEDEEIISNRASLSALTSLHILKTYTKISNSNRITTDWIIFGLSKELSTTFENTYAIAFKFEDILSALSSTNIMWYNGKDQLDSTRLDESLRKQYIAYNGMTIYSVYRDTIMTLTKQSDAYLKIISEDTICALLYEYVAPIIYDFNELQKRMQERKTNKQVNTYQLQYSFTSKNNSALTKNTLLIDALLDAIRTNKISVYNDVDLTKICTSESALSKLDKTRFYKTGNAKKDSIYISKIPVENRFIKNRELTEFTIKSNYTITKKKVSNQGCSFGIFIPAELHPQYELDTLCYISFNAFVNFLQKNKTYKKLSPQFVSLLNEHAIISVEDFYDLVLYEATEENAAVPDYLPVFVRERCGLQSKTAK